MGTTENLREAFAGESQANQTYLGFAKKAEAEGYPQIAKLFRAAAEAERVHAQAHLSVLGGVKTTAENLQAAMSGEAYEFTEMYPGFVAEAERAGNRGAVMSFSNALAVEKIHHSLYAEAARAVSAGKDLPVGEILVCSVCGNTVPGGAPERCPICGSPRAKFFAAA
jgi:rubrerythrin